MDGFPQADFIPPIGPEPSTASLPVDPRLARAAVNDVPFRLEGC